ncbi:CUB domain-containing protein 1 isoform X1 [Varanus komodoensis]|uniref:CUB domain-containing protein 1 isoform X1 n=1 Tax=Varanus komodoensis TaxID=61221 RepID=UPI001CF7E8F7|nr:CUB domain-containing protein 1 isoform X1 [Varanus komodoensis]
MAAGRWVALLLLAAGALALPAADAFVINLRTVENITVKIKPGPADPKFCQLFVGGKPHVTEQKITPGQLLDFTFGCQTPEKYWVLVVERDIDCSIGPCPLEEVLLQPSGLPRLNRTFAWEVKADRLVGLELKFSTWLRQLLPGHTCSDQVLYNIGSRLNANRVNIGNFCRNGPVSRVKVQGGLSLTLHLPWDSKLNSSGFILDSRSSIRRLFIIEATFLTESSATLMSANYPLASPEDELMTWIFVVPSNLRAHVRFLNYTKPNCERKYERVEYGLPPPYSPHEVKVLQLNEVQPVNIAGNFNLSLHGCDQDNRNPGSLSLLFQVDVRYPINIANVTHIIDLRGSKNMNITIYSKPIKPGSEVGNQPECLVCVGHSRNCKPNATLFSEERYSVTFLCRNLENVRIAAEQSIVCWNSRLCQDRLFPLMVPRSLTELPILMDTFTWKLHAPDDVSIEIKSPTLKLKQHIPNQNQMCTGSYSYSINSTTPGKALSLGLLCPGGAIEKIKMRDNVTITLRTYGKRWFSESQTQNLQLFFRPEAQEDCIFTLTPDPNAKIYLQTPNWLEGLPPFISSYWNISVQPKQVARLSFLSERMGVTCEKSRAFTNVKEQRPNAEETVCRDDEKLPRALDLRHHFWVNITNCKPSAKRILSMQFVVTLNTNKSGVGVVVGAVVGTIVVLAAVGLVVCCVIKKKKNKKKKESQVPMVGVYNTNINTQIPGRQGIFKKERKKNESHVYAVIDEAMVYGHLLDNSVRPENAEVGVYRPFSGPMITTPPSPPPIRKASKAPETEESLPMLMTDNENYTFTCRPAEEPQSNGDVNVSGNGTVDSKSLLEQNKEETVAE